MNSHSFLYINVYSFIEPIALIVGLFSMIIFVFWLGVFGFCQTLVNMFFFLNIINNSAFPDVLFTTHSDYWYLYT